MKQMLLYLNPKFDTNLWILYHQGKINFYIWGILAICLTVPSKTNAQDFANSAVTLLQSKQNKNVPLKQMLKNLEKKYKISFNYNSEIVEDKYVNPSDFENKTVDQSLSTILDDLGLTFLKLDINTYVIQKSVGTKIEKSKKATEVKKLKSRGLNDQSFNTHYEDNTYNFEIQSIHTISAKSKIDKVISGTIKNSAGEGVPGASILVKGTTIGTISDADGAFNLNLSDGRNTLIISSVGFISQEIEVGERTTIEVILQDDLGQLEEIVVLGYGSQQRKDVTGSVASLSSKDFQSVPLQNLEQAMQGRAAGVLVTQNSGAPGGAINVLIRGVGTTGNNEPIYVIDGVITGSGNNDYGGTSALSSLNPNDIESIDILKDASAAAIYGSRGANGVVIITTKRAKAGKPKVGFEAYYGVQNRWKKLDLLNSRQHSEYINEAYANAGRPSTDVPLNHRNPASLTTDVDWQDEMFRSAPMQSYNLSIGGGNENATYNISGNYFRQDGTMLGTYFDRKTLRANSDFKISKRIRVGQSLLLSRTEKRQEGTFGGRLQIEHIVKQGPGVPIYNPNYLGGFNGPGTADGHDAENPVAVANLYTNRPINYRALGNVYIEVDIIEGLTFRTQYGIDYNINDGYSYNPENQMVRGLLNPSQLSVSRGIGLFDQFTNTLNYSKKIGSHSIEALVGYETQKGSFDFLSTAVRNLPNNAVISIAAGQTPNAGGGTFENALESVLGRVNYSFKDKYLLTFNVRRDGSSKLAPQNRYQVFPSFSVGWRISEESFMKSLTFVTDLKIRGGYGELGNVQSLPDYPFSVALINSANYNFGGGQLVSGVTQTSLANRDIKWETAATTSFGIEGSLLKGALNFTIEYYKRQTKGLQVAVPVPPSVGLGAPIINAGNVENRGFDFSIGYRKVKGDLSYGITANFSTITNEVTSLGGGEPIRAGNTFSLGNLTQTAVGRPIGAFFGFITDGIFQTQEEVNAGPSQGSGTRPGDIRFKDLNGDGIINDNDQTFIGNPTPDFFYGINGNVGYKGFDLSIFFQGVQGNNIFNAIRTWTEGLDQNFNQGAAALNRWKGPGTSNDIPRAVLGDPNNNKRNSNRFVEDGSFLRLKNITIGYSFKPNVLKSLGNLSRLRVYFTGQNLLTFTKYSGFDPELGSTNGNALARGIDIGSYPQARSFVMGVQIDF
jgi:TonB-linked SusC/RagA family outer membrane protein